MRRCYMWDYWKVLIEFVDRDTGFYVAAANIAGLRFPVLNVPVVHL